MANVKKVIDMFNGRIITYPVLAHQRWRFFDFHFTKNKKWYYVNSCNDIKLFKDQQDVAKSAGQKWRIVDAVTGEIIKQSE